MSAPVILTLMSASFLAFGYLGVPVPFALLGGVFIGATLGGAFVVYTIYKNFVNVPSPYSYFGWIVLVWLLVGAALVVLVPGLAHRVRTGLALSRA